jgi:hypothetical protein
MRKATGKLLPKPGCFFSFPRMHANARPKISAGSRSDMGRDCRDAFLGIMKTCANVRPFSVSLAKLRQARQGEDKDTQ